MSLPFPNQSKAPSATTLDPKVLEAMDAPLIALTNQCGGDLRRLMFAFFSFLHRRTDFYAVPHPDDLKDGGTIKMGFREGDAEKLLLAAFRQFPLRRIPPQTTTSSPATTTTTTTTSKATTKSPVQKSTPVSDSSSTKQSNETKAPAKQEPDAATANSKKDDDDNNLSDIQYTEEGLQIPVGNGGATKRYKWTQTISECSVLIAIPPNLKGKDLDVSITSSAISVRTKKPLPGDDAPRVFIENGTLFDKIRADESTWSLEGGVLVLILEKRTQIYWGTIVEGDEKIDTSLVDSRRHISEYDDATQQQIRKIIFDQTQERRGLPTSDKILGTKPTIPNLPPGVEYINQQKVDDSFQKETGDATSCASKKQISK